MSDDLLARLRAAQSAEERDWLVTEALLESLPAELRQAAWAAAVPHWFDSSILATLLEKEREECAALCADLQALPFVEPFEARGGHNVHDVTRTAMLAKLWSERRDEYAALSARAAATFAGSDEAETRIEEIYHLLIADPDAGSEALWSQGWAWHKPPALAYDRVYALAGAALEHAAAGRLDRRGAGTANLLSGTIDTIYSRNREAMEKLKAARQASKPGSRLRASSSFRLGRVHRMLDEYAEARERYEEARLAYAAIGNRVGEAMCIQALGDVHYSRDEYAEARERYEEARTIYAAIGDRLGEAGCIAALGDVHKNLSEYAEATERYEEATKIYTAMDGPSQAPIGSRIGEANRIKALGDEHYRQDEYTEARARYEEARPIYAAIGDRLGEANCVKALGDVHWMLGEYAEARARYEEARPIYAAISARLGEANCIQALGHVHLRLDEYAEARERYEEARLVFAAVGNRMGEANCIKALGDMHYSRDEYAEARERYEEARLVYAAIGNRAGEVECLEALSDVHKSLSEYAEARERLKEATKILRQLVPMDRRSRLRRLWGRFKRHGKG